MCILGLQDAGCPSQERDPTENTRVGSLLGSIHVGAPEQGDWHRTLCVKSRVPQAGAQMEVSLDLV
jgi:hypothetical protein